MPEDEDIFGRARPQNEVRRYELGDGRIKVFNGVTTAEEIVKAAQVEGIVTG